MCVKFTLFFSDLPEEIQEEKVSEFIENTYLAGEYRELELEDDKRSLGSILSDEDYRAEARQAIEARFPITI